MMTTHFDALPDVGILRPHFEKSLTAPIGRLLNILQGTLLPVVLWTMQGWSRIQTI